jgi:hypothetical protein
VVCDLLSLTASVPQDASPPEQVGFQHYEQAALTAACNSQMENKKTHSAKLEKS